jgi:hypothetical protein
MDLEEIRIFVEQYDGEESGEARDHYLDLTSHADANLGIVGELGPSDAALLIANTAMALWFAETIGYRYQGVYRRPIAQGAIFVEDLDHHEINLTPGGSVSYRRDWMDREEEEVRAFLCSRYPLLEGHFTTDEA